MAVGLFSFIPARCHIALCIPVTYTPTTFYSKFPEKASPVWNLLYLFPPMIWGLTLLCIILVVITFLFSSFIYSKIGNRKSLILEEIVLVPTRSFL